MNTTALQAELDQIAQDACAAVERYQKQLGRMQQIHNMLSWATLGAASAVVLRGPNSFGQIPSITLIGTCALFLLLTPIDAERELLNKLEETNSVIIELNRYKSSELTHDQLLILQKKYGAIEANPD